MSSLVVLSRGLWLMPAFSPRTNNMAMLFVRGENAGISHNPLESTTSDDMQLAVDAFTHVLNQLALETA